ncbi:DUF1772 domain-containing protein (plasmid) [Streptomyces sp. BI20]|uniref:anthrone oxygenase family protein n=1 Tax=Streptomyces sp. BI20 TaxID=3403460 RepID=UPI003C757086
MEIARVAALGAATLTAGLVAGLFWGFGISVMPALRQTDDRTLIEVMQRINRVILNGWFLLGYLGTALFTALAAALTWFAPNPHPTPLPVTAALVVYLASLAVTGRINIPLNNALEAAGPPEHLTPAEATALRTRFESPWTRANRVRTLLCTLTLALLTYSLLTETPL